MPHQQNRLDVQIPASFLPHLVALSFPFTKRLEKTEKTVECNRVISVVHFFFPLCSALLRGCYYCGPYNK